MNEESKRQSFQLRLPKDVHAQATERAWESHTSLNEWIVEAVRIRLGVEMQCKNQW